MCVCLPAVRGYHRQVSSTKDGKVCEHGALGAPSLVTMSLYPLPVVCRAERVVRLSVRVPALSGVVRRCLPVWRCPALSGVTRRCPPSGPVVRSGVA